MRTFSAVRRPQQKALITNSTKVDKKKNQYHIWISISITILQARFPLEEIKHDPNYVELYLRAD